MFRSINGKFNGILGLLVFMFLIGYAEVVYFLNKQSRNAAQGMRIVQVEREIRDLRGLFFEMRFWERAVFSREFSDAEQHFGNLMARLRTQLARLDQESPETGISGRVSSVSELLRMYERDFNHLMQINIEHRLQRTRIDAGYQSLASSILSIRDPNLLKPMFVLTQFQMSYVDNHRDSEYQALQVVIASLRTKLSQSGVLDDRLGGYLNGYTSILDEDVRLDGEFALITLRFNETSTALTDLLSNISQEMQRLLKQEIEQAERIRESLNHTFLLTMAVSLALMLLVITLFAQKILRPVRSVGRVIRDVKSGNMASRFNPRGGRHDEIVQLGLTFNEMLDTLAYKNQQLVAYQKDLEDKVRELDARQKERETLIRELEAKNAELERFTYTVSHDLKSPLITIQGFLGFLEKDAMDGDMERMKEDCNRIKTAAGRMQQLLNELLELSRIGRLVNPPENVPFDEIVREAAEVVSGRMTAQRVRLDVARDMPMVFADRERLREVVENLLDNAGKYMGAQAEPLIEIGCRRTGGEDVFYFRDNGIGIDPSYQARIFGLFEKLDPSVEGTGVGLAIVKRIIEMHGGRIWVESNGAGSGSTFCFTLPAARNQEATEGEAHDI